MSGAVVYIDDEPAICRLVQWRMEGAGLPVATFTDPHEALDWIGRHPVRCVLCDHRMPGLSGLEVRERLAPGLPFWLVTGDLSLEPGFSGPDGGPGVLYKPFDFDALVACVRRLTEAT